MAVDVAEVVVDVSDVVLLLVVLVEELVEVSLELVLELVVLLLDAEVVLRARGCARAGVCCRCRCSADGRRGC